jgi:hypothetical protein
METTFIAQFTRECPECMDLCRLVQYQGRVGRYYRCLQCAQVYLLVGDVLVSAVPPEYDLEGARHDRMRFRL